MPMLSMKRWRQSPEADRQGGMGRASQSTDRRVSTTAAFGCALR